MFLCRAGDTAFLHGAGGPYHVLTGIGGSNLYGRRVGQRFDHFSALAFNGELNGLGCSLGAQVVHAGFKALFPAIEVHGSELAGGRRVDKKIQRLRLADIGTAVGGHVDDITLFDLPHGFVDILYLLRDLVYRLMCSTE